MPLRCVTRSEEVKAPQWLYTLHGDIVEREFDGRGMRWRDHVALAMVRWTLDRFEMMQVFGRPW